MRYALYGSKIPFVGKTLWEIVGNLKNFGVGRYVELSTTFKQPCFFQICKVQALPPPRNKFENREVMVWVNLWHKGILQPPKKIARNTDIPKFRLIPKAEEHKFLQEAEECQKVFKKKELPKYLTWPPLYEILWSKQHKKFLGFHKKPPKLEIVLKPQAEGRVTIRENDIVEPPKSSNMHQLDAPVEAKIQEIIKLKRIIKSLTPTELK